MTISDNYSPDKSSGDGSTLEFSGVWSPLTAAYMRVYLEDKTTLVQTLQVLGSDYDLSFDSSGYVVTFKTPTPGAPPSTDNVIRAREVALDQTDPYKTAKGFQGAVQENSFDKLTAIAQDNRDAISRAVLFPIASGDTATFAPPVDRGVMYFDGTVIKSDLSTIDDLGDAAAEAAASAAAALVSQNAAAASESSSASNAASTAADVITTNAAAVAAAASATLAASTFTATSTSSNTIGTGSKTFAIQANKNYLPNVPIIAVDSSNPANYIYGTVGSYSGTSLVITGTATGGSGTITSWNISIVGIKGTDGAGSGTVTTTGSPSSGKLAAFSASTSITNTDLTGDVTTSGGVATTIGANKVTLAKIAHAAASSKLVGSGASGSGANYEELSLGTNLSITGTTLNASGGSGTVVQQVTQTVTSTSTSATALPYDDTIPQNTEGGEFFSQAVTPTNSSNILEILGNVFFGEVANSDVGVSMALFQDSTAAALWAGPCGNAGNGSSPNTGPEPSAFLYRMTAGTTSATTIKLRCGTNDGSTTRINGSGAGRIYGGVAASYLIIKEMTQ